MDKVILRDNQLYREWLDRIKILLMRKAIFEKRKQDVDNKTVLGNSSFWFQKEHNGENFFLIFDKDPTLWDLDRLKIDIENLELAIYKQSIY